MTAPVKPGFQVLQDTIADLTHALGGHHFCRVVLAKTAAHLVKETAGRRIGGYNELKGLYPGQILLAADDEFIDAAAQLNKIVQFKRLDTAHAVSLPMHGGVFALRGSSLVFETDAAALCVAYAFRNNHSPDHKSPWTAMLTDAGDILVMYIPGATAPDRAAVHAKTEEAARQVLMRFAEQHLCAPLTPHQPATIL